MMKRNTKSALLSSVLALFLCFTMLLGTTFAWFTDSVTSANNLIRSGNLDVELDYWDAENSEWKTIEGTSSLFANNLWEPGHTEVVYLKLSNLGSLALKYQLSINVLSETQGTNKEGDTFKLSEYIQMGVKEGINGETNAYADRATAVEAVKDASGIIGDGYAKSGEMIADADELYMAVVVYMPETVDNEANAMTDTDFPTINLGLQVLATQYEAEDDSFDNQYDTGLDPTTSYMFSGADLHNSTTKSGNFKLSEDIKTSESTARYGWGYEYIIRNGADYTLDLNGKTIVHDTINENANNNALTYLFVANHAGTKLTINGEGKIYSNNSAGWTCAVQGKDGTLVTINGGDFEVDNGIAVWAGAGSHVVINGGSYVNGNATTDHELIYSSGGVIDIYGGFFHNTDGNYTLNVEDRNRATSAINVYGGTFVNFDPSTGGQDPNQIKVAEGYMVKEEAQENGDVWYTVVPIPEGTETVSSYESLTDASGTSGDHVLVGDLVATDKIFFGDNTTNTIDLNGKSVSATGDYLFATSGENCVLTINGEGDISADASYAGFATKSGELNINGGTYQLGETTKAAHFYSQNSGTIVINDGTFVSTDSDTPIVYCINGFIEINGGFFQNTANPDAALISMGNNLNYVNNQKVTLSGGTFVNWNPVVDSAFAYDWPQCPALIVLADGYQMVSETQANGDVWYIVAPIE